MLICGSYENIYENTLIFHVELIHQQTAPIVQMYKYHREIMLSEKVIKICS